MEVDVLYISRHDIDYYRDKSTFTTPKQIINNVKIKHIYMLKDFYTT